MAVRYEFSPAEGAGAGERSREIARAASTAQSYLLSIQNDDGHWCAELEGDTILESEYILTMYFLGRGGEPKLRKAAEYLRRKQLAEGGWAIYPGGPAEVSASVKAYFVLKLLGDDPNAPHMAKAKETILRLGGIEACNSFTRIYLSIFGQYEWERCPAVPPEIVLLPDWFVFNVYRMSSWSRAIVVPLSIIWATKPSCAVPDHARIDELRVPWTAPSKEFSRRERSWRAFFDYVDKALKAIERSGLRPLRRRALAAAEAWITARLEKSDGLGAIFPPIINTLIAFRGLGDGDSPRVLQQLRELGRLEIEDEETLRVQPCFSSIWDTALALQALADSGMKEDDPSLLSAARWLLDREVKHLGDWKKRNPDGEIGGWYFEYANEFYPDCDDTAEVLMALSGVRFATVDEERRRREAIARGLKWQLTMQNEDGGWGAFDKGCDDEVLTLIPFADHNAMIDPSCEDITGRTLDALWRLGLPRKHPSVDRAVAHLWAKQEPDGTWYGRWGCNYVYGTWLALRGLSLFGEVRAGDARVSRAVDWIRAHQNEDGGWGELPTSYDDPHAKGHGPSTPSQTAWALMALFSAGDVSSESVERGIDYLLERQKEDGSWVDETWTGTGFPRVFYLRYHLYATYFPLWALSLHGRLMIEGQAA
jgi:squalene-hopene/tetraprenyl-beta-curcumene cyclase